MKSKIQIANRIIITVILIMVQLIIGLMMFLTNLREYSLWFWLLFSVLGQTTAFYIIAHDSHPSFRIVWLAAVLLFPIFGTVTYILYGRTGQSKALRNRFKQFDKTCIEQQSCDSEKLEFANTRLAGLSQYLGNQADAPLWKDTDVKYYSVGEELFAGMLEDLKKAEQFIFLEYFIIQEGKMWNAILDILEEKVNAGVEVRVMYDDVGSLILLPPSYSKNLEAKGIQCIAFNRITPLFSWLPNFRDHRKILVIDGKIAYTGGINLADEYINEVHKHGHWKDTGIRLEGNGVWSYTRMFLSMWNTIRKQDQEIIKYKPNCPVSKANGYVQPYCSSPLDPEPIGRNAYIDILNQAKSYVYIFTPYLIIDDAMQLALTMAAKRGVDVRIVTPGIPDKKLVFRLTRSYCSLLLKQGVRIYEYSPGFIHAKSCVCDDECAMIGTINLDYRSLFLSFECASMLYGTDCIMDMKKDAENVFKESREIGLMDCHTSFAGSLLDAMLRTIAPLM